MKRVKAVAALMFAISLVHLAYWRGSNEEWFEMTVNFGFAGFFLAMAVENIIGASK